MVDKVKLPSHQHPLHRAGGFDISCRACNKRGSRYNEDGYRCSECYRDFFLHKECAESPEEINNLSLHHHPLRLSDSHVGKCSMCGDYMFTAYNCSLCPFSVHTSCARNPPPLAIEHPKSHHHSLSLITARDYFVCHACGYRVLTTYACEKCGVFFHVQCVDLSQEINHPSHPTHPLKLLTEGAPNYADDKCSLCGDEFKYLPLYHCSFCKFSIDLYCARDPPPLTFLSRKTHEHKLTLLPRHISFTCNACGDKGDRSPYVCLQCYFMIHRDCIDLPHVININRHEHRISLTYFIGSRNNSNWMCRICCKIVDWAYGAYSCSVCHDYVVHPRCAVKSNVWDGRELEGEPGEKEDIEPFVKIADNMIKHFSHEEHNLILNGNAIVCKDNIRCKACIGPIYFDPSYICSSQDCDFVLHERCASLPRKKRHVIHTEQLNLVPGSRDKSSEGSFHCDACKRYSSGFRYQNHYGCRLDVRCGSICEPLNHKSHPHPLYFDESYGFNCSACGNEHYSNNMRCLEDGCGFRLDFGCIVLPEKVKHESDDHPLLLCYGEEESGEYWCDVCEKEIDPKLWFYTCEDGCATTLHTHCVDGELGSLSQGFVFTEYNEFLRDRRKYEVVPNNQSHRPLCYQCGDYCKFPNMLKICFSHLYFLCSYNCFEHSKFI